MIKLNSKFRKTFHVLSDMMDRQFVTGKVIECHTSFCARHLTHMPENYLLAQTVAI